MPKNLHKTSSLKSFIGSLVINNETENAFQSNDDDWTLWPHIQLKHLIHSVLKPYVDAAFNICTEFVNWTGSVRDYYYSLHKRTYATKSDREERREEQQKKRECTVKRFNRNKTDEYDSMKRKRINRPYAILASNWLCTTLKILYFNTNTIRNSNNHKISIERWDIKIGDSLPLHCCHSTIYLALGRIFFACFDEVEGPAHFKWYIRSTICACQKIFHRTNMPGRIAITIWTQKLYAHAKGTEWE